MRNISTTKGDVIKSLVNAGMSVTNAWSYIGEEVGGFDKAGSTVKDMQNFVYTQKMKFIEAGDAQSLVNQLQKRQSEDPMFYYTVQFDQESRLTNVFWRDGKSKLDYDCFGDVMSMGNQQPKTIFTDQDAAMAKAIKEVMPNTSHRLCLWHIAKNAPSHLGALNSDHKFQCLLQKCMSGCDSEEEFESTWNEMMSKHNGHKWLEDMYKIRHKWSTAYSKKIFSAGIKSSQRSESTNSVLSEIAGKTTSLTQFFNTFEKMEYLDGTGGSTSVEIKVCDNLSYHEVIFNQMPRKKYIVTFDSSTCMVNCSCHKFEFMGILCSHALRIYNIKGILKIPDHYFLKRWSKNVRSTIYEHMNGGMEKDDDVSLLYRNAIMKSFYYLVLESQEHKETQQIMWNLLDVGVERVQECLAKLNVNSYAITNDINSIQNENNGHVPVLNPALAKTKGMPTTRRKGHFEKRKRSTTTVKKNKANYYINGSNMQSSTVSLYRPIMSQMAPPIMPQVVPPIMPQMASPLIPFCSPQILQPAFGMQNIEPTPIRPHALGQKTSEDGSESALDPML
ncbi:unnamed protein product [Lupinus luteus]|uniref:SWIM-type domain-containing protein n=1 Tax=Lupinus luteus TaxID=3873 RepID=A0AAV1X480_LUPLU